MRPEPLFTIGMLVTSEVMLLTTAGLVPKLKQPWLVSRRLWLDGGDGYKWWYGTDPDGAAYVESALRLADPKLPHTAYV